MRNGALTRLGANLFVPRYHEGVNAKPSLGGVLVAYGSGCVRAILGHIRGRFRP